MSDLISDLNDSYWTDMDPHTLPVTESCSDGLIVSVFIDVPGFVPAVFLVSLTLHILVCITNRLMSILMHGFSHWDEFSSLQQGSFTLCWYPFEILFYSHQCGVCTPQEAFLSIKGHDRNITSQSHPPSKAVSPTHGYSPLKHGGFALPGAQAWSLKSFLSRLFLSCS